MNIEKSLWERIGAFDSKSASGREKFAADYRKWIAQAYRKPEQKRTESFEFSDLLAQDPAPQVRKPGRPRRLINARKLLLRPGESLRAASLRLGIARSTLQRAINRAKLDADRAA